MKNQWKGGSKWDIAKTAIAEIADSIALVPNCEMGMRVFGHLYPEPDKNCHDSRLEIRIDSNNTKAIKKKLEEIRPKGITPLVYSIEKTIDDFGSVRAKNILIIVTDGEDACDRDIDRVLSTLLQFARITAIEFLGEDAQVVKNFPLMGFNHTIDVGFGDLRSSETGVRPAWRGVLAGASRKHGKASDIYQLQT